MVQTVIGINSDTLIRGVLLASGKRLAPTEPAGETCYRRAGSTCIFLQIRKQQRKWAAGMASRSFMKLTAGRWQRMDIASSNRPIMSG